MVGRVLTMPCTIPGVGFEWPHRIPRWYKWRGARCSTPPLATSIISELAMEIFDALVDLGVFPIWDIPFLLKSAQEDLASASLILERPREEQASDAGPWI
jgi:hypothetical protein